MKNILVNYIYKGQEKHVLISSTRAFPTSRMSTIEGIVGVLDYVEWLVPSDEEYDSMKNEIPEIVYDPGIGGREIHFTEAMFCFLSVAEKLEGALRSEHKRLCSELGVVTFEPKKIKRNE